MDTILEQATIKINFKMEGNYLAQVTLNWKGVFEVRFFRIRLNKAGVPWFQPPSTGKENAPWAKCFIVNDINQWHELQNKVIKQFMEELEQKVEEGIYSQDVLKSLEKSSVSENLSDEEIDKIDKAISNSNL